MWGIFGRFSDLLPPPPGEMLLYLAGPPSRSPKSHVRFFKISVFSVNALDLFKKIQFASLFLFMAVIKTNDGSRFFYGGCLFDNYTPQVLTYYLKFWRKKIDK